VSAHPNKENKEMGNKIQKESAKEEKSSPNDIEQFKTEY
jgi:hypothetical protein